MKSMDRLRHELDERVVEEFERFDRLQIENYGEQERVKEKEEGAILHDVCFVVDAFGDSVR
jgi:hypothetical protein